MPTSARPFQSDVSRPVERARIFVVETDEVIRSALQFILQGEDATTAFANFDRALEAGIGSQPDVVLLGIGIVHSRGDRAVVDIAARLPGARILLVADSATDPLAVACLGHGAHAVLGKPITIDAVRDKVDLLLGRLKTPATTTELTEPAVM